MLATFKRLLLGLLLIAAASALLLFSDLRSRTGAAEAPGPTKRVARVALLQHASQLVLDQGRDGIIAGLADRGWTQGDNLQLKLYNAQGDMSVAQTIAKEMVGGDYDLLLTVSTVSLQAVANANRGGKTPHVFGLVSDPYGAGVGISRTHHLDHPAHLAGFGTMQPVALSFQTAREMNPALATVGVVWNAAEANSEAQVKLARQVCAELKIKLLESTVDSSAGVSEAANALVARGVDAIWMAGDVTVLSAADAVMGAAKKGRIPAFTVIPPNVTKGALFDVGADYPAVGRLMGQLAGDILNGKSPAAVSIDNVMPEVLTVNQQALAGLKGNWKISPAMLERAELVIDGAGVSHAKAEAAPSKPIAPEPGRTYRLGFASFAPEPSLEACQRGLLDGLKDLGFVVGKNLTVSSTHAQGEMVNISAMIQNLDNSDIDVIVPFSTPVLQGALRAAKKKPIVFTYISDPIAAGAGKTFANHLPNVTGIGSLPPVEETMKIMQRVMPGIKKVGVLYNGGEANSVKVVSILREVCARMNLEVIEVTASNSNEIMQAAQALVARGAQEIYIPSDNTAYLAFEAIAKTAEKAKIPLVMDDDGYIGRGGFLASGPGYYMSGKAAAVPLARVLLGESPAGIPMANVSVTINKFSRETMAKIGVSIPEATLREIETVPTAAPVPQPAYAERPLHHKKWKIEIASYNETPPAEETLKGMADAWQKSALVEGKDYEIKLRSAQGDIASMSGIIDAALTDGADIIVPMSTPSLQIAVKKVKKIPLVFALIANPMVVGAGKSYTDHLPNVTGVSVLSPFERALDLIKQNYPQYKRLGTLFCPAEANSVDLLASLQAACKERGFTLDSVAVNSSGEITDSALALMSRPIDAVLQLSDNLSSAGFSAIGKAARQSKKPLFALNSTTVPLGAALALGRDYHDGGEAVVKMLERVMAGESPATMPFELPPKIVIVASPTNAAATGMTLTPEVLKQVTKLLK